MFILIEYLLKCSIQLKFLLYLIEVENAVREKKGEEKVRKKKKRD